jgi:predicted phage terminase large subunit-like protein
VPLDLTQVQDLALANRIEIERELGRRSFWHFFRMAWRYIDPAPFVDGWHLRAICDALEALARRDFRELVLCVPPRHTKSLLVSVCFPAWVWTWDPAHQFITASYDQRLAVRDGLKSRRLVKSAWFQQRWPEVQFRKDQDTKTYYETTAGGHRFLTTPGSGVTGHGADTILGDDLHNAKEATTEISREEAREFWFESISSRLNDQMTGAFGVIQQRLHNDDVAGHCMRKGYHKVVLPALFEADHPDAYALDPRVEGEPLWPARMPLEAIERQRQTLGAYAFAGQQQQRPTAREGGLFKRADFIIGEAIPPGVISWVRRWDLAGTEPKPGGDPDYTVGVRMGRLPDGRFVISSVIRERLSPLGVEKLLLATAQLDGTGVTIGLSQDPGQAGKAQIRALTTMLNGYMVVSEPETGSKFTRAEILAPQVEAGNLLLLRADWNEEFLVEMQMFPNASHDDQVDAATGAHRLLTQNQQGMLDLMRAEFRDAMLKRARELIAQGQMADPEIAVATGLALEEIEALRRA